MPGSARDRKHTKTSIQQRQAQQRDRPSSTVANRGEEGPRLQLQPNRTARKALTELGVVTAVDSFPLLSMGEVRGGALSPTYTPSAKSPTDVGREIDRHLAHIPRQGDPLTPAQEEALDLLRQIASDLAIHAHHSHLDEFIRRLGDLGAACGRAVADALREAQG